MSRDQRSEELRQSGTKIIAAATKGDFEVVHKLFESNNTLANYQESAGQMQTPLIVAATGGFVEIVQFLLEAGADVNLRDSQRRSPLLFAVTYNRTQCVAVLLRYGADTRLANASEWTPLFVAAMKGHTDIAFLLIDATTTNTTSTSTSNASSNTTSAAQITQLTKQTNVGATPLIAACQHNHLQIAQALIHAGAEVDAQDNLGATALMKAAEKGHAEIVQLLLQSGADPSIKDKMGGTALKRAESNNYTIIIAILTQPIQAPMELSLPQDIQPSEESMLQLDADYTQGRECGDTDAVQRILAAADSNDPCACAYTALLCTYGCCVFAAEVTSAVVHAQKAVLWLDSPHIQDLPVVLFLKASFAYEGIGVAQNETYAIQLLRNCGDKNCANALYLLSYVYMQNIDTDTSSTQFAMQYLHLAATMDHLQALCDIAYCRMVGYSGVEMNHLDALKYYEKAAAHGHGGALNSIGLMYQHGTTHVAADTTKAYNYYTLASARLNPAGMYNLGICLQEGTVVAQDMYKAAALFQDAARLGYAKAQVEAGLCVLNGTGVSANDLQAVEYFKMAAAQGNTEGLYRLGWCLAVGRGVDHNIPFSLHHLRLAAAQDHMCARVEIAFLLAQEVDLKARAEAHTNLQAVLPMLLSIGNGALYMALPDISLHRDEEGMLLRETNGLFRVCQVDPHTHRVVSTGPMVTLTRQWMLHAAPVLKATLALLVLNNDGKNEAKSGVDVETLLIAMSMVHDPQGDPEHYTPDIICAGDCEDMILLAYQTIKGLNVRSTELWCWL